MPFESEKWERVLSIMSRKVNETSFSTWLENLKPVSADEVSKKMVLATDTGFAANLISNRYKQVIAEAVAEVFGVEYSISVIPEDEIPKEEESDFGGRGGPEIILNPKFSFQNFVVGNSNRFAYAAAVAVAETPSCVAENPSDSYNPLFIYSGSGLGKTHLMHAIGMHILRNFPDLNVLYVTSEMFTNEFIAALQSNTMAAFKNKYRNIDVLMIDDIEFLEGKEGIQEEFFHTFNTLFGLNKQIIISSDREPSRLEKIDDRLRSRFQWTLVADIGVPDFETRVAILQKKAELVGLDKNDEDLLEVINLISDRIKNNIRELEGAFNRVFSFSTITGEKITLKFAKSILKDIILSSEHKITPDLIKKTVAKFYGVRIADLEGSKRAQSVTRPRQVAIYICSDLTDLSTTKIGECFGGRDHSTVIHSIEKISKEIIINEQLEKDVNRLINMISE